jgi:hypothetical protein
MKTTSTYMSKQRKMVAVGNTPTLKNEMEAKEDGS